MNSLIRGKKHKTNVDFGFFATKLNDLIKSNVVS